MRKGQLWADDLPLFTPQQKGPHADDAKKLFLSESVARKVGDKSHKLPDTQHRTFQAFLPDPLGLHGEADLRVKNRLVFRLGSRLVVGFSCLVKRRSKKFPGFFGNWALFRRVRNCN